MQKQWTKVYADKDQEVVIVLDREAAAVALTYLEDALASIKSVGLASRSMQLESAVSEIKERLSDE